MKKFSVYTPTKVAKLLIRNGIKNYFNGDFSYTKLKNIKVCDLTCGNGNLLLPMVELLILLSKRITGNYCYFDSWITGYDINENAVKLTKIKIVEILKNYNLSGDINIFVVDSLSISTQKKFNIVLGNPPYIGEKNNKEIFQNIKKSEFGKKFYEAKMDYFYFFIIKGIEILEENGILSYLTTNYWLRADSGVKLREFLKNNGVFLELYNYDSSLFIKAKGQHNIIFLWKKNKNTDCNIKVVLPEKRFFLKNSEIYDETNKIFIADKNEKIKRNKIIRYSNFKLGDLVNINQGIVSGYDKAFILEEYKDELAGYLKPFYKSKDIGKYFNNENKYWILYLNGSKIPEKNILDYLFTEFEILSKRREVILGFKKWWELQWSRDEKIFTSPKILVRQRYKTNQFSYDEGEFYGSADIYFITQKNKNVSLFYILGFMNSKIFLEWFKINGKMKGKNFEFYSTPLKETPIYYPENTDTIKQVEKLVKSLIKNYDENTQKKLDTYFYEIYNFGGEQIE